MPNNIDIVPRMRCQLRHAWDWDLLKSLFGVPTMKKEASAH